MALVSVWTGCTLFANTGGENSADLPLLATAVLASFGAASQRLPYAAKRPPLHAVLPKTATRVDRRVAVLVRPFDRHVLPANAQACTPLHLALEPPYFSCRREAHPPNGARNFSLLQTAQFSSFNPLSFVPTPKNALAA